MSLRVEPPEKKQKPKNPSSSPSFSYIPDEIAVNCLARISRSNYPRLSIVSKSFGSLLSSTELYAARSHLGNIEQCLYVCLCDRNSRFSQWFTLWINPNRTLPNSSVTKKKTTIGQLLVPITSPNVPSMTDSTSTVAVVGSEIYVIGGLVDEEPSSAVRILDCRSHTWRDAPSMNVARHSPFSCVYDGKIYVIGGCEGLEAEVFDTKTQTWERLPNPGIEIPEPYFFRIAEIKGKICIHHITKMYAYDPKQDKWECGEINSPSHAEFECVVENVSYRCVIYVVNGSQCVFLWYDIKDGNWKEVKGLDSLSDMMSGDLESLFITSNRSLVSFGGKLLLIWEGSMNQNSNDMKNIWCAEIMFEKRDGGEVWGNAEWADFVHTVPGSCKLVHCLAVSV